MPTFLAIPVKRELLLIFTLAVVSIIAGCSSSTGKPTPVILDPGLEACTDRVLVIVWGDLNQDGVQDPDEPPLAEVLLSLAPKDDPKNNGIQLATNQDGRADFRPGSSRTAAPSATRSSF